MNDVRKNGLAAMRGDVPKQEWFSNSESFMRMALKAQSQCRATLETLAQIKNPSVVFARQANIAQGPQQVNNTMMPAGRSDLGTSSMKSVTRARRMCRVVTDHVIVCPGPLGSLGPVDEPPWSGSARCTALSHPAPCRTLNMIWRRCTFAVIVWVSVIVVGHGIESSPETESAAVRRSQSTTSSCVPAPMSSLVVNPRNAPYNAKGDGATNDTAALQKAVDAVGGTGGTLLVPAGTYMIDASTHLLLKANMTLSLAPGTTLKAIPNGLEGYAVILVNGVDHVNVVGGVLEGERDNHTGTTGEWGMGLQINNAQHVVVEGVTAKECWGDGFYVGGASSADVTFCNVVADHNRRQGMSVTSVDGLVVRDSVFKNTAGTLPETGLDIEPNRGETVTNALVAQCTFTNNAGGGLQVGPARVDMAVTFVTNMVAERNIFRGNGRGDGSLTRLNHAIRLSSCTGNIIRDNRVEDNFGVGISVLYTTGSVVTGNTVMRTKLAGSGNERGAGIILENDKGTVCSGNTVTGNEGHGIFTWKSNATVTGNTVSGNGPTP